MKTPGKHFTREEDAEIAKYIKAGFSVKEVANMIGCSRFSIYHRMELLKITPPRKSGIPARSAQISQPVKPTPPPQ